MVSEKKNNKWNKKSLGVFAGGGRTATNVLRNLQRCLIHRKIFERSIWAVKHRCTHKQRVPNVIVGNHIPKVNTCIFVILVVPYGLKKKVVINTAKLLPHVDFI